MTSQTRQVRKREISFANRTQTMIWQELPAEENPYLVRQCRCHGYDLIELATKRSFADTLYLLFQGELPTAEQASLLETLFVLLINPGPRHPATRAAMNAAVSRTRITHLLPIGLSVLGGEHLGAGEVLNSMRFIAANMKSPPAQIVGERLVCPRPTEGDFHPAPGFGSRFGGIDPMPQKMADLLGAMPGSGEGMAWAAGFVEDLRPHGLGWLLPGLAAAIFYDLGLSPWAGAGLFQFACAPGILAHGLELADKPLCAMPFLDEESYVISSTAKK